MAIVRKTDFDPETHGFRFRNSFNGLDIVENVSLSVGDIARLVSEDQGFWDGWGLCGGMSWYAIDLFNAGEAAPKTKAQPAKESELFRGLVDRQVDSLRTGALIYECARWGSRAETGRWWDPRPTTRQMTARQWPRLKQSIDAGQPASLTLIRATTELSKNHQVVATGYCADASGRVVVDLYDPNHPGMTDQILFWAGGADAGRVIQPSEKSKTLRGLFVWPYRPREANRPEAAAPAAASA